MMYSIFVLCFLFDEVNGRLGNHIPQCQLTISCVSVDGLLVMRIGSLNHTFFVYKFIVKFCSFGNKSNQIKSNHIHKVLFGFLETVIIVPAANTAAEQSIQNENIEQIRKSRELGPANQQSNVKSNRSFALLADDVKSGDSSEMHDSRPENEDEKTPMSKRVYQNTTEPVSKKWGSNVNCRTVLYYVAFVGFMVNYMYRVNINIAIVGMVSVKKVTVSNDHTSECIAHPLNVSPGNMTTSLSVNGIHICGFFLNISSMIVSF